MLPWSVMPIAGWPSAAAAATTSPIARRTVEHRVLGVHVQMDEGPRHGCDPAAGLHRGFDVSSGPSAV